MMEVLKKDLSTSHREAVIDFINLFNDNQKLNFEVKLKYMFQIIICMQMISQS